MRKTILVAAGSMFGSAACLLDGPAQRPGSHLIWQPLPTEAVTRIAFGSCAFQWDDQPIWNAVIAADPDLFLYIGDAIYGDFDGRRVYDVTRDGTSDRSDSAQSEEDIDARIARLVEMADPRTLEQRAAIRIARSAEY